MYALIVFLRLLNTEKGANELLGHWHLQKLLMHMAVSLSFPFECKPPRRLLHFCQLQEALEETLQKLYRITQNLRITK